MTKRFPKFEKRALVLVSEAEIAELCRSVLEGAGISLKKCADMGELCREMDCGAGVLVLSEDVFSDPVAGDLVERLARQPVWSDMPVVVLTREEVDSPAAVRALGILGNVIFLQSPFSALTLASTVRSSIRSRLKQHQIRRHLKTCAQTEKALRESETRFRSIFDMAAVGIGLCLPDGRFIQANRRFCEMLGYSLEELQNLTFREVTLPEDLPGDEDLALQLTSGKIQSYTLEKRYIRRNGDVLWASLMCSAVRDQAERLQYVVGIIKDISERKRAEQELHRREQEYKALVENAMDVISRFGPDLQCLYVNPAIEVLTGYPPGEFIGKPIRHMGFLVKNLTSLEESLQRVFSTGREELTESEVTTATGVKFLQTRLSPELSPEGEVQSVLTIARDITAMKWLTDELREAKLAAEAASRTKSEFLANMSHEIRTPMTVVLAAMEQVLDSPLNQEQRQYLEMADNSAHALLRLIDDILDFSRMEAGKMEFEETPFDLRQRVQGTVDSLRPAAERKRLRLSLQMAPEIPQLVLGDPDRLRQVLANLIGNAVKFTDQGEVTVTVGSHPSELSGVEKIRFSIRDTGIGIPRDKMNRLFESFSQVDSSTTRRYGGTGLGLAVCKGIVRRLGGDIWVESEKGKGSVFTFTLPFRRTAVPGELQVSDLPLAALEKSGRRLRILLAEDDLMIARLVEKILRNRGWEVTVASSGREAVDAWEVLPFDLVLMDVQMPDLDGFEATRQIRRREKEDGRHTPIIALTAHARKEDRRKCLAAGMDGYLAKPVKMERLYSTIEAHVKN